MTLEKGAGLLALFFGRRWLGQRGCGLELSASLVASDPIAQSPACHFGVASKGALPNNAYTPPSSQQSFNAGLVTRLVASKLLVPEFAPGLGKAKKRAPFVTVPKATVYKDRNSPSAENQIWFAGKIGLMEPIAETHPP